MTSLYDLSIPVFIRALGNLHHILKKAEQWADENKVDHSKLIQGKLADDMKPLTFQVQMCSDFSKGTLVRVGGLKKVALADNETTFEQLQQRCQKTTEVLKAADPESMNGKEGVDVDFHGYKFTGRTYLMNLALPNFFFHETTAYAILRNAGVPLGKMDYLGAPQDD